VYLVVRMTKEGNKHSVHPVVYYKNSNK